MRMRLFVSGLAILGVGIVAMFSATRPVVAADKKGGFDPVAVERARQHVKMLDDLYKTAVVGITATYVDKQDDTPAAAVAKKVFEAMHKKGYHKARLVDASGKPKSKDNEAVTEFEKKAVAAMKDGKTFIEECAEAGGKKVYRAATIVPAVMKQCTQCHKVKEGELLGTLVYEVEIK
jgi:Protein of unknown function (DUF3365)